MARLLFDLKNKNKNKTRQTKHWSVLVCDSFYLRVKYKFNNTLLQTGNLIMKHVDSLQQQHQKLYLHDHKGITVLQKLLV